VQGSEFSPNMTTSILYSTVDIGVGSNVHALSVTTIVGGDGWRKSGRCRGIHAWNHSIYCIQLISYDHI